MHTFLLSFRQIIEAVISKRAHLHHSVSDFSPAVYFVTAKLFYDLVQTVQWILVQGAKKIQWKFHAKLWNGSVVINQNSSSKFETLWWRCALFEMTASISSLPIFENVTSLSVSLKLHKCEPFERNILVFSLYILLYKNKNLCKNLLLYL